MNSYSDQAVGHLEENADGKIAITEIFLYPKVEFAPGVQISREELGSLHASAHKHCFIANSISAKIEVVL